MNTGRLAAYRRFVEQQPASDDGYLFDQPRPRFWPEPGDELVAPALELRAGAGAPRLVWQGGSLELVGVDPSAARAALLALGSGQCSYSRLLVALGPSLEAFLEATFGRVLFAPRAVTALEAEVSLLEIVRFPASPYQVVRSYWRNMALVRRRLEHAASLESTDELRALILELHRLLLLGADHEERRSSFYLPASALARKHAAPGSFYEVETGLQARAGDVVLTGGARIGVPFVGGASYWQLLAESVDDLAAVGDQRSLELDGVPWGQVVMARSENEPALRPWFLPPRPLREAYFAALLGDLQEAARAESARDVPALLGALARFHFHFVRLHPLPSANQSLSMAFVNRALRGVLGAGIPHLLLDQLALRFELAAYRRLFTRAVTAWGCGAMPQGAATSATSATSAMRQRPAERLRHFLGLTAELNRLVSELSRSPSLFEARAVLEASQPRAAELALLADA